jgi:hypothetical protein
VVRALIDKPILIMPAHRDGLGLAGDQFPGSRVYDLFRIKTFREALMARPSS